jgi:hypothetical protein
MGTFWWAVARLHAAELGGLQTAAGGCRIKQQRLCPFHAFTRTCWMAGSKLITAWLA